MRRTLILTAFLLGGPVAEARIATDEDGRCESEQSRLHACALASADLPATYVNPRRCMDARRAYGVTGSFARNGFRYARPDAGPVRGAAGMRQAPARPPEEPRAPCSEPAAAAAPLAPQVAPCRVAANRARPDAGPWRTNHRTGPRSGRAEFNEACADRTLDRLARRPLERPPRQQGVGLRPSAR